MIKCFVVHQGVADLYELFGRESDVIFFPEAGMSKLELAIGCSFKKDIVTESEQLISCFNHNHVYIREYGEWVRPDFQTYACSYSRIRSWMGYVHEIPIATYSKSEILGTKASIYLRYIQKHRNEDPLKLAVRVANYPMPDDVREYLLKKI